MSEEKTLNEAEPFWRRPVTIAPRPDHVLDAEPMDHTEPEIRVTESNPEPVEVRTSSEPVEVRLVDFSRAAKQAEHALDLARAEARERRAATMAARTAFAKALANWNASGPVMTQEQALRAYVDQSNIDRARRVAAGQGVYHPGITRTAKAMSGGNAKQGGGTSYRRGAFTRAQAMEIEAGKLRAKAAAAAVKPR